MVDKVEVTVRYNVRMGLNDRIIKLYLTQMRFGSKPVGFVRCIKNGATTSGLSDYTLMDWFCTDRTVRRTGLYWQSMCGRVVLY